MTPRMHTFKLWLLIVATSLAASLALADAPSVIRIAYPGG
jgi:hypothetical protein